ncbi:MAG: serine acetyltransferase [Bacteroidales bacterium]|nr:serine acetyltransferase [Bacteroidales bacterium]
MKAMGATAEYTDHYYKRKAIFDKEAPINSNDIVFLGNSLTEGGKWSQYFADVNEKLAKKGGAIRNRGIVGDTFGGIDARLDQILPGQPKTIFFLTGANDVSHNLTADSIANGIINVVRRIKRESPKTKIYLQSLLPINESFKRYRLLTGKTAMFSEINAKLKEMAKEEKVTFIEIYPLFLTNGPEDLKLPASEQVLNPNITRDGLHLTQEGYKIWTEAIRKYVK